ncbi:MAG: hypothetical protein ACE5K2_01055 [Candidatus Zixiibacteriota bacterium]
MSTRQDDYSSYTNNYFRKRVKFGGSCDLASGCVKILKYEKLDDIAHHIVVA